MNSLGQSGMDRLMKLVFPATAEDLDDGFNNAFAQGVMQRDHPSDLKTFFAKFELIASDVVDDEVIADWFLNEYTNQFTRVPRKDGST